MKGSVHDATADYREYMGQAHDHAVTAKKSFSIHYKTLI
jgi:hypothetical protein